MELWELHDVPASVDASKQECPVLLLDHLRAPQCEQDALAATVMTQTSDAAIVQSHGNAGWKGEQEMQLPHH